MDIGKEKLRKMFPHLATELEDEDNKVPITSSRSDADAAEKAVSKRFDGYNPDVVDFIRRCDTEEQAEEIIEYLERRREINQGHAAKLRRQLKEKGVGSFGSKKEDDYYLKQAGY